MPSAGWRPAILILGLTGCVDLSRPPELVRGVQDGSADGEMEADGPKAEEVAAEAPAPDVSEMDLPPPGDPDGMACTAGTQCRSGRCVDGVCCESACLGVCQSCNAAGSAGRCTPIAAGQDPGDECGADDPSTCARDGTCNGNGGCRLHAAGTACAPQTCAGATESSARTCDGAGACRPAMTKPCAPYKCAGAMCAQACGTNNDCEMGSSCAQARCSGLFAAGAACTAPNQCRSGFCVDGVCCQTACGGSCQACNLAGSIGSCAPIPSNQDPANECPTDNPTTCGRDGMCDGVGGCRLYPAGSTCAPSSCVGGVEASARTCDGLGVCRPATSRNCAPFPCNGTSCGGGCMQQSECQGGTYCESGQCRPKLVSGSACTQGYQCNTGQCSDSVCCDRACGICQTCNMAGSVGVCRPIAAGQDPGNECGAENVSTCGRDGSCNGSGACRLHPAGTVCAAQTCAAGVESSARTCSGMGVCMPATTRTCAPLTCSGTACATTCAQHADCAPGRYCNVNMCADLTVGLTGYWKLDETSTPSRDSSGNGQDGVWEGTPVGQTGVTAPVKPTNGGSLRCDAPEMDRVRIARSPNIEPTGAFTVAIWIRRSGNVGEATSWAALLRKSWMTNGPPSRGTFSLQLPLGDWSQIAFGTGHPATIDDLHSTVGSIPDGVWTHVTGIYDPTGPAPQKRLYINGTLNTMRTLNLPVVIDASSPAGDLYLCDAASNNVFLTGNLDDLRVYTRALSPTEITALVAGQ